MVSLLDIIGPVMVGPSSSHTAGACRIGLLTRALCGGTPDRALIELHGSFAKTGEGHGTDRALVGGLLGFEPDDGRLREARDLAQQAGMAVQFETIKLRNVHPNTARLTVSKDGQEVVVVGSSLGGGRIAICEIDGLPVDLSGEYPTLVVVALDQPGTLAAITAELAQDGVNVATVRVSRNRPGGVALHLYELDETPESAVVARLAALQAVQTVRLLSQVS
jgi:L-serine dehydratase